MPGTKPIGPGALYVKAETTPFTWQAFAVTDAIRHIGVPSFGSGARQHSFPNISRGDRGRYNKVIGRYNDVPVSFEIPLFGGGTAGTAITPRTAIFESACGFSSTVVGGTSVTYESDVTNPAGACSLYYVDRNAVLGQYVSGFISQSIALSLDKENIPKWTISGIGARKTEFMKTTLGGALDGVAGTTAMTLASAKVIRNGDTSATALSGLEIYVTIGSEHIKITAFNLATKVATIVREQLGSSAAAHDNASVVTPYAAAPTYGESGLLLGPEDWTVSDGSAIACTAFQYTLNTGRAFDALSSGSSASSALHNGGPITGEGSLSFLLDQTRHQLEYDMDKGTVKDLAITCGATGGSIFTVNLDASILRDGFDIALATEDPLVVTLPFDTIDSATAQLGQLQVVET